MADGEYRRLTCSVGDCGGNHKAHGFCIKHYRQWQRGGVRESRADCAHCKKPFQPSKVGALYCSKRCKLAAWKAANPDRASRRVIHPPTDVLPFVQTRCAYFAGYCQGCGVASAMRRSWTLCSACIAGRRKLTVESNRPLSEAKHRAAGSVVQCDGCGLLFCPLFGFSCHSSLCSPCAEVRRRAAADQGKSNVLRAKRAGVPYRYFNERKVLERDGWTCQLCGIPTPAEARGSTRRDAPEFDHCIPLALGGPHIPENGQCLCRMCNSLKSDNWCAQSVAAALHRGVQWPLLGSP